MQVRTPIDLGLIMRDRRRSMGLTQSELAARAGVSRQWIIAIEHGKRGAPIGLVLPTLNALGLRIDVGSPDDPSAQQAHPLPIDMIDLDSLLEQHRDRQS